MTAVIKVMNDLLMATDHSQLSALCLLDLTAAFNNPISLLSGR